MLDFYAHKAPRDVVMIHGAGGTNMVWRSVAKNLSGDARAFALNLPGHPAGDITCKTIGEYADAVSGFIGDTGLRAPVVCGHSMGSAIALTLGIERPEAVGGLILVGAGAKLGVDPRIVEGLKSDPMKTIERTITPMSYFAIDLGLGREGRAALSFSNIPVFLNDYLACDGFDARNKLGMITARTLIVCGDGDRMTQPMWAHYLNSNILGSELSIVRDSGHMLPLEKPATLAKIIQLFLARLSR